MKSACLFLRSRNDYRHEEKLFYNGAGQSSCHRTRNPEIVSCSNRIWPWQCAIRANCLPGPRMPPSCSGTMCSAVEEVVVHTCDLSTWAVETKENQESRPPQPQNKFKASLGYVRPCLRRKGRKIEGKEVRKGRMQAHCSRCFARGVHFSLVLLTVRERIHRHPPSCLSGSQAACALPLGCPFSVVGLSFPLTSLFMFLSSHPSESQTMDKDAWLRSAGCCSSLMWLFPKSSAFCSY